MDIVRAARSQVDVMKQCVHRHSAEHHGVTATWAGSTMLTLVLEPGYCPVRLGMTTGRLQSGVNTLQGFKEDKRNKVTPGKAPMC